mmetsp:Transcript_7454/g.24767  ORF Transcript_7454/g.24767 Transcript_7454/m.24767 type:complete len:360 (+) Transcript_7454:10-1089(+)
MQWQPILVTLFLRGLCQATALSMIGSASSCSSAPSQPADRRTNSSKLVIAQYNVDFLFLSSVESEGTLECPGRGCDWTNASIAQEHLSRVASQIARMDADIVSLNEVESCDVLHALIAAMPKAAAVTYTPYLVLGEDRFTGQNVGMLSRVDPETDVRRTNERVAFPVAGSQCNATAHGTEGVSKNLIARFHVAGMTRPLTFVAAHLLAQPTSPERCSRREAQAVVLAVEAHAAHKRGDHVIIAGDMNDFDDVVLDSFGNKPISNVLHTLKHTLDPPFISAAEHVPRLQRFTDWYDRNHDCKDEGGDEHSMIDHVLLSQPLAASVTSTLIDHAYPGECFGVSDHWPVVVSLDLTEENRLR